jgi:UDP-N-acetylmuramyl pentapeptide phosphotransferase/UDP-N-acetylglucosamine-1-phosphate transferase
MRLAEKFDIVDRPNHRSSHAYTTLRGGGVIIFLAIIAGLLLEPADKYLFYFGISIVAVIGFSDDLFSVSRIPRLVFHLIAIGLLLYNLELNLSVWMLILVLIIAVGILNAYNFMDGINGISGLYSLVFLLTTYYVNNRLTYFIEDYFILFPLISILVFGIYNFRKAARLFMGDVGSTTIAYLTLYLIGLMIVQFKDWSFVFFMTIYGVDSVLTIVLRIKAKENIFQAHRSHLYQLLANEIGMNHIHIAMIYAVLQLVINIVVILNYQVYHMPILLLAIFILVPIILTYGLIRYWIYHRLLKSDHA